MISFILIALAAICNSIQDTLAHHHSVSVFSKHKKGFWSDATEESWKNKYKNYDSGDRSRKKWLFGLFNLPVQFSDAWHMVKSLTIIILVLAVVLYQPVFGKLIDFFVLGAVWNLVFLAFYKYLLIIKK